MSPAYLLYNTLISLAAPVVVGTAVLRGRLKGNWLERLGFCPPIEGGSHPRIWVHAASVGETHVAHSLLTALMERFPGLVAWLTTTTDTGRETARQIFPEGFPVRTFPLDAYGSPGRALNRLKPDMIVMMETELWPNLLRSARQRGTRIMMANGRISPRSFSHYSRFRFLFREVVSNFDLMAMIRPEDRERILALGADPTRVQVVGNAKYDLVLERQEPGRPDRLRKELRIHPDRPVWVAGSTRVGEEEIILDVFKRLLAGFPRLHLVLVPRHVQRADEIEQMIRDQGLSLARRTRPGHQAPAQPAVTLVDVMGELFDLYGLADVAFCGASLVPHGGQNVLEPAVWSVPVLFGPYMDDFMDAKEVLESVKAGPNSA